jgi:8-oxo-dGTP diphosphatase
MEHSKDFPDCFHRVTIKGLCIKDGKVLLVRESKKLSGKWELPGGGLDFGENIHDGFKREIQEEMGLTVSKMSRHPVYVWTHKFKNKRKLEWYYSLVVAYQIEFENLDFIASDECEALDFFTKDQLQTVDIFEQAENLREIFNPEDFDNPLHD